MTREKAIERVMNKYPNYNIDDVSETDKYFLISISRKGIFENAIIKPVMVDDGLKAIDKISGQVFTYNPILHKE